MLAVIENCATGVSIGSINAACVVGAKTHSDACARLNALWDDLTLEAPPFWVQAAQRDLAYFGLPGFYAPRQDFWTAPTWTYVYDTRPLLVTLGRHVDFAALNASPTTFVVTAVEVVTGTLRPFANKPIGNVPAIKIEPRHVLASGSLPPGFPWTEIDGMPYWDGGLVDNTPLGLAIDAFSTGADVDRLVTQLLELVHEPILELEPDMVRADEDLFRQSFASPWQSPQSFAPPGDPPHGRTACSPRPRCRTP